MRRTPGRRLRQDVTDECEEQTAYGATYALGDEVGLATVTPVVEGSGAVRMRRGEADDGTRHGSVFWDAALDRPCYFLPSAGGELRCLGLEAFVMDLYSDAACTQPRRLAIYNPPPCGGADAPHDGYGLVPDGCTYRYTQYRLGALANPTAYQKSGDSCYEWTFPSPQTVYDVAGDATADRAAGEVVVE